MVAELRDVTLEFDAISSDRHRFPVRFRRGSGIQFHIGHHPTQCLGNSGNPVVLRYLQGFEIVVAHWVLADLDAPQTRAILWAHFGKCYTVDDGSKSSDTEPLPSFALPIHAGSKPYGMALLRRVHLPFDL